MPDAVFAAAAASLLPWLAIIWSRIIFACGSNCATVAFGRRR
jgi:hypothetical protein